MVEAHDLGPAEARGPAGRLGAPEAFAESEGVVFAVLTVDVHRLPRVAGLLAILVVFRAWRRDAVTAAELEMLVKRRGVQMSPLVEELVVLEAQDWLSRRERPAGAFDVPDGEYRDRIDDDLRGKHLHEAPDP